MSTATAHPAGHTQTTAVISLAKITKRFGTTDALNGLDLTVDQGEVHGFLGPNGAGKSTSIRILLGLIKADTGSARVFDMDSWRDSSTIHRRLAYVPGDVSLWPSMTGGECIDFLGRLRGGIRRQRRNDLLDRFGLDPSKKCKSYSKGNLQKVALVAAFATDADLLVLDEPSSGLDPLMEVTFQECVREAATQGRTVLLSSHILSEVEQLCDRISIVRSGAVIQSSTLGDLHALTRSHVSVTVRGSCDQLGSLPGIHGLRISGSTAVFDVEHSHIDDVISALTRAGIESITCAPPTLEELFLEHYGPAND